MLALNMGNKGVIQSFALFGLMATLAASGSDKEQAEVSEAKASATVNSEWGYFPLKGKK
jgi:hypothetical protein